MGLIQNSLKAILPASLIEKMRNETNQWQIRCETCNSAKPLWEAGGIRYKKRSTGSVTKTLVRCSSCGEMRKAAIERVSDTAETTDVPTSSA